MNAHIKSAGEPGAPRCSEEQPGSNPSSGRSAALARFASDDFQYRLRDTIATLARTHAGAVQAGVGASMTRDQCARLVEALNEASQRAASHPDLSDALLDAARRVCDTGICSVPLKGTITFNDNSLQVKGDLTRLGLTYRLPSADTALTMDSDALGQLVNLLTCAADVLASDEGGPA